MFSFFQSKTAPTPARASAICGAAALLRVGDRVCIVKGDNAAEVQIIEINRAAGKFIGAVVSVDTHLYSFKLSHRIEFEASDITVF